MATSSAEKVRNGILAFVVVAVIATLALSVITLIKVSNSNEEKTPPPPTVPPTIPTKASVATSTNAANSTAATSTSEVTGTTGATTAGTDTSTAFTASTATATTAETTVSTSIATDTTAVTTDTTVTTDTSTAATTQKAVRTHADPTHPPEEKPNIINVYKNERVNPRSQPHLYAAYQSYENSLKESLNLTFDPCNNFYEYTCGSFNDDMSFDLLQARSTRIFLKALKKPNAQPYATKTKLVFDKCVLAAKNPEYAHENGEVLRNIYGYLQQSGILSFPILDMDAGVILSPKKVGQLLGILQRDLGVSTLITPSVSTNWKKPQPGVGSRALPYKIFLDQPTLQYPQEYYDKLWDEIQPSYHESTKELIRAAAEVLGKKVNEKTLDREVAQVLELERVIATKINAKATDKRNYERSFNPYTISEASNRFSFLNFTEYLTSFLTEPTPLLKQLRQPDFEFIVNEPKAYAGLNPLFEDFETVYNYIHVRLLYAAKRYIPAKVPKNEADKMLEEARGFVVGGAHFHRRPEPRIPSGFSKLQGDDYIEMTCAQSTMMDLKDAATRIFIDEVLPGNFGQKRFKEQIGKFVNSVLDGFQYQIDRLNWMSHETKEGAYEKIKYLARNIAFPEWVLNTRILNKYYESLEVNEDASFFDLSTSVRGFKNLNTYGVLVGVKSAQRANYELPMSVVNAWYLPEINGLTLPYAILQQPFYDPNYPASVNFGALGVVTGHEISHAFDDMGIQYDGVGVLRNWIDDGTKTAFGKMAQCVVDEYSRFEPLPGFNIDGVNTQGENIADNGGIHAAFNAFQAHQDLYGVEPQLPGDGFAEFTHEQLFFLAFARTWCEVPPSAERMKRQLLVDPHSPSKYRVFGTLQNFPAFKAAFNCLTGSDYAPHPSEHCSVWASEVDALQDVPDVPTSLPDLQVVKRRPDNSKEFAAAAKRLQAGMNLDVSPCDDFHAYTCSANASTDFIGGAVNEFYTALVKAFQYPPERSPEHVELPYYTFISCVNNNERPTVQEIFTSVEELLPGSFNLDPSVDIYPKFDFKNLSQLNFRLAHRYGVELFYKIDVRPNLKRGFNEPPYLIYIDRPDLTFTNNFYRSHQYKEERETYLNHLAGLYSIFNDSFVDKNHRQDFIAQLRYAFEVEEFLGSGLDTMTSPSYETISLVDFIKRFPNLKLESYLGELATEVAGEQPKLLPYLNKRHTKLVLPSVDYFQGLNEILEQLNTVKPELRRSVWQYVYVRLLWKVQQFLGRKHAEPIPPTLRPLLLHEAFYTSPEKSERQRVCARQVFDMLPPLTVRNYLSQSDQTRIEVEKQKKNVAEVVGEVAVAFEKVVDELDWMPTGTKKAAVAKIRAIARTVGYPSAIFNDTYLRSTYKELVAVMYDGFYVKFVGANALKLKLKYKFIFDEDAQRDSYLHPTGNAEVPASVHADRNAIALSLPLIVSTASYSHSYPAAYNFATVGTVVGELIGNLFHQQGLKHDLVGQLKDWADVSTRQKVLEMAYDLEKAYRALSLKDIDSDQVLAKHTGLLLAHRALRAWDRRHGEEPALAHPIFGQFTSEQLFFTVYSQLECGRLVPSQPAGSRILALLGNTNAFRNAFNCPLGSKYAPQYPISVWQPTKPNNFVGVPEVSLPPPSVNVPKAHTQISKQYLACAKEFEDSVDTSVNPCTDFHQYTCGNYEGQSSFGEADDYNQAKLLLAAFKPADNETDSEPVLKLKAFLSQCRADIGRFDRLIADGSVVKSLVADLKAQLSIDWPLITGVTVEKHLTPYQIGKALGFLNGRYGHSILLDNMIYTNSRNPDKGYSVYVLTGRYELESLIRYGFPDDLIAAEVATDIVRYMNLVLSEDEVKARLPEVIEECKSFVRIERLLIKSYDPTTGRDPRNMTQKYPSMSLGELVQVLPQSIDLKAYFEGMTVDVPSATPRVTSKNSDVVLFDPKDALSFFTAFGQLVDHADLKPQNLINYLFYRTIMYRNAMFLPAAKKMLPVQLHKAMNYERKVPPHEHIHYPKSERPLERHRLLKDMSLTKDDIQCFQLGTGLLDEATNALFVKTMYADEKERDSHRLKVAKFADSIMIGFRAMLNQLAWMKPESKQKAYNKIDLLVKNIGFPNISVEPDTLNKYYEELDVVEGTPLPQLLVTLYKFNQKKTVADLAKPVYDRTRFGKAFNMNAWYQPAANSITLPTAILQKPFYDPDWPAAVNFGAIGVVAGHELVHGFDDSGVQWDGVGRLKPWIDADSFKAFREMADCVVKEYGRFCYEDGKCVDGARTQGENIADNGGIRAAFRAYRAAVGVNGPDARLPSDLIGQFTNDQLFFLAFGRVWCQAPYSKEARERILADVHAPSAFRILGTLQNFPAFQQAFNCPAGSAYAPKDHCDVWITDIQPSLAVPTPLPPKPVDVQDDVLERSASAA